MQKPKKKGKRKHGQTKSRYISRRNSDILDKSVEPHLRILNTLMSGDKDKALQMTASLGKAKQKVFKGYLKDLNCFAESRDILVQYITELNKKKQ